MLITDRRATFVILTNESLRNISAVGVMAESIAAKSSGWAERNSRVQQS